jgi:hypothetical protein
MRYHNFYCSFFLLSPNWQAWSQVFILLWYYWLRLSLRHLPRRPLVHLTHLFNHCIRLAHFPTSWKEAKVITLPKPGKNPKFPQNLRPISLLPTTGKLFEKVVLKIVQRHIEERGLHNACQFGFRARHSTTLQCMRLTDHVTLNFNNNMSTAAVFLDIEKAFDTTWHTGLLYKLYKLKYSTNLIKLISSFLPERKFTVSVEGKISTPRYIQAGMPQGSVLSPKLYSMYINDSPPPPEHQVLSGPLCWWHLYVCHRSQRWLYSQKAAARSKFNWYVVQALEH